MVAKDMQGYKFHRFFLSICVFFLVLMQLFLSSANAFPCTWQALTASFGAGEPNQLKGARISYQFLPKSLTHRCVALYFDISAAYWRVNYNKNKSIFAMAVAPVLRINLRKNGTVIPYFEGSIGGALFTQRELGHRDLGSKLLFQDMVGLGVNFGNEHKYDVSIRYLHYSNADIVQPNNGIDVKLLLTFGYHF